MKFKALQVQALIRKHGLFSANPTAFTLNTAHVTHAIIIFFDICFMAMLSFLKFIIIWDTALYKEIRLALNEN